MDNLYVIYVGKIISKTGQRTQGAAVPGVQQEPQHTGQRCDSARLMAEGRQKKEEGTEKRSKKRRPYDHLQGYSISGQRRPLTGPYFLRMPATPTSITAETKLILMGETSESKVQHLGLVFTKHFSSTCEH